MFEGEDTSLITTFDEYQDLVDEMPLYDDCLYGLATEVGELIDVVKKGLRPNKFIRTEDLVLEAGDVLWYLARFLSENGIDLVDVATKNIEKLNARHSR